MLLFGHDLFLGFRPRTLQNLPSFALQTVGGSEELRSVRRQIEEDAKRHEPRPRQTLSPQSINEAAEAGLQSS